MSSLKDRAKSLSYMLGPLGFYHMLFNRARLTVVMFHRVLPRGAAERSTADDDYTVDAELFDECLGFFERHYTVVSLEQVLTAANGGAPLPGWPLLITFDDGWADTLAHAAPLLAARHMPAACFVVSNVLDDPTAHWWQDRFGHAWRTKRTQMNDLKASWTAPAMAMAAPAETQSNPYLLSLAMMSDLAPDDRTALLDQWLPVEPAPRQMLTAAEVPMLPNFKIAVGAHGASHVPLTLSRNPDEELAGARRHLKAALSHSAQRDVTTLSFPHGRFTTDLVDKARECGYRMMFTSSASLMELDGGRPTSDVCGRIEIATHHAFAGGHFRPDLLACRMFLRPTIKTTADAITTGLSAAAAW